MIIKYSWLQYKRIVATNKILFGHIVIFIPLFGIGLYYVKDDLVSESQPWLSHFLFFIFLFQSMLIVSKRLKNEDFFSPKSYTIFPQKKIQVYLYSLLFGIIDLNVVLMLTISIGILLFATSWSLEVKIIFFIVFLLVEITYLIIMMITIEIMTVKHGNSKNLVLVTFLIFIIIEQFTRLSEKFYLFDYYPISGWIGSTVLATLRGDFAQVIFNIVITIFVAVIGAFLLDKVSFPKRNNVF